MNEINNNNNDKNGEINDNNNNDEIINNNDQRDEYPEGSDEETETETEEIKIMEDGNDEEIDKILSKITVKLENYYSNVKKESYCNQFVKIPIITAINIACGKHFSFL